MTSVSEQAASSDRLELHSGDRMSQAEFHHLYSRMPDSFQAELIGGIVYVASPLKLRHGTNHLPLGSLFFLYEGRTPGVQSGDNATILLGDEGEPQPDLFLRILPEFGGCSSTSEDDFVLGGPELVAEIAFSSYSIDFHAKRDDYARYGVQEYLVVNLRDQRLHRIDLITNTELPPDPDGVHRMSTFPGLWIDCAALLSRESTRMIEVLEQGLASPEHAEFVSHLEWARNRP